ncbi:MAG: extracellular solute-binding protein [Oscillospiraceae bacterium]|nr:extracellular solute-binding protein [Oscillospiraceae bacterium]
MKKPVLAMLLAAALVFAVACGGGGGGGSAPAAGSIGTPENPVTVRTSFTAGEFTDDLIVRSMAELPGLIVEREEVDDTRLMAMIAAGTAPDIVRMYAAQSLPMWVTRGLAMPIQDYVDKSDIIDEADFLPIVDVFRWDGKTTGVGPLYGIPKDWSLDLTVWINKVHFQNAGIPIPNEKVPLTFEEYADYAQRLHVANADGTTAVYGAGNHQFNFNNLMFIQSLMQQQGLSIWSDDYTKVNLNNDNVKYIFNVLNNLVMSKTNVSPLNPAPAWDGDIFRENLLAMKTNGYWYSGVVRGFNQTETQRQDQEIVQEDVMMLPAVMMSKDSIRLSACTHACGGILLAQSQNPDAAWRLFEWFLGPAGEAIDRAKGGWGLPSYRSLMELLPDETEFDKQAMRIQLDEIENSSQLYVQMNPYLNYSAVESLINKYVDPIYFGESTIDEALPQLERDIQLLIDEGIAVVNG